MIIKIGAEWVKVDVAERVHKVITVYNELSVISSLKEMAVVIVLFIEVFGVVEVKQMKDFTWGELIGFKEQMDVIAHQTVRVELKWIFFVHVFKGVKVSYAVVVVEKNIFFAVAS
nr:hypothetical protein [Halobacillus sp. A5]